MSIANPHQLGLGAAGALMTPEEFDASVTVDDSYGYELVHGVLVVTPIPAPSETSPNQLLGHLLLGFKHSHPQGAALDDTLPEQYVRTPDDRRRADRVIWAGLGRVPRIRDDVPTIVVEFLSAGTRSRNRDYIEKRREYLALGTGEYWIIDRFARGMTVYYADGSSKAIAEAQTYTTALLPGFDLPLARLLGAADLYADQS